MSPSSSPASSRYRALLAVASLLLAAGCSGEGPVCCGLKSAIVFDATGRVSLQYQAEGRPRARSATLVDFSPWVTARHDSLGGIVLSAFRPTDDVHADVFVLQLTPARTGEFDHCGTSSSGTLGCQGRIIWHVNTSDWTQFDAFDEVTGGTVTVLDLTATHIRATFSLTLHDEMGAGPNETVITNGQIDADFADGQTAAAVQCTITRAINHSTGC